MCGNRTHPPTRLCRRYGFEVRGPHQVASHTLYNKCKKIKTNFKAENGKIVISYLKQSQKKVLKATSLKNQKTEIGRFSRLLFYSTRWKKK